MGSDGSKPRKKQTHLPKVPRSEEPNQLEGTSAGGFGRAGHQAEHHSPYDKPTGVGAWVLKVLGKKPSP